MRDVNHCVAAFPLCQELDKVLLQRGKNVADSLISSPTWPGGARNALREVLSKSGLNYFLYGSVPQQYIDAILGLVGKV